METDESMTLTKELGFKQNESLKLERNSRGYNWTISIINGTDTKGNVCPISDVDIQRLEQLNDTMVEKFGSVANGKD